jgi:hypothetical protein
MAKTNVRRGDRGSGADFINHERAIDEAVNERIKSETDREKIDPRQANNRRRADYEPDLSEKKTGRRKH